MNSSPKSVNTARKPHVALVSYYFPPMGGGGVQRIIKFLKYADLRKFDITVITVKSSYFYANDPTLAADIPAGVRVIKTASLDPFRILHLLKKMIRPATAEKAPASRESGDRLRRLAGRVFVPDSRALWMPFVLRRLRQLHRQQPVDLVIGTLPPFTAGLAAVRAGRKLGIPVLLDYRDGWSVNPYLPQNSGLQSFLNQRLEQYCLRHSAGIVFVNPALAAAYEARFPAIQAVPHTTIRNGYDPDDFAGLQKTAPQRAPFFELGVMGSVYSQGNSPETLLQAVRLLRDKNALRADDFRLTFLGKWTAALPETVRAMKLDTLVNLENYLPHCQALQRAARFDALALMVDDSIPGSRELTPGRIYEYLALRRPILAICPINGDVAALVNTANAGEVVAFGDVERIAACLSDWLQHRQTFAGQYTFNNIGVFSREQQAAAFWQFAENLVAVNPPG